MESRVEKEKQSLPASKGSVLNIKVILVYLIFLLVFTWIHFHGDFRGNLMYRQPLGVGSIGPLFIILFIANPLVRLFTKRAFLSIPSVRILIAMLITGLAWVQMVPNYVGNIVALWSINKNGDLPLGDIWTNMSSVAIIKDNNAGLAYFTGQSSVPWGIWIGPIITWSIFALAFYAVLISMANIFRSRWMDSEHLQFPLIQPIIEMTKEEDHTLPFWTNRLVWIGFAIGGLKTLISYLQVRYVPGLKPLADFFDAPTQAIQTLMATSPELRDLMVSSAWSSARNVPQPYLIGLGYIIDTQFLFNTWFWDTMTIPMTALAKTFMVWPPAGVNKARAWLPTTVGGTLAVGAYYIWMLRGHLKVMWKEFINGEKTSKDLNEGLSYRESILLFGSGLLIMYLLMVVFLQMSFYMPLIFLSMMVLVITAGMRLRSEVANYEGALINTPWATESFLAPTLGHNRIGRDALGLNFMNLFSEYSVFNGVAPATLESYALNDGSGTERRIVMRAITTAVLLALVAGWPMYLTVVYRYGANLLGGSEASRFTSRPGLLRSTLLQTNTPSTVIPIMAGIGAVLVGIMSVLRMNYIWFPFHPLGFIFGINYNLTWLVSMSFFISWLTKVLILRWGGRGMMVKCRPFFLGMIAGDLGVQTVTNLFDSIRSFTMRMRYFRGL